MREVGEPLYSLDADQDADSNLPDHININELWKYMLDDAGEKLSRDTWLSPVSLAWPMGFSHS